MDKIKQCIDCRNREKIGSDWCIFFAVRANDARLDEKRCGENAKYFTPRKSRKSLWQNVKGWFK